MVSSVTSVGNRIQVATWEATIGEKASINRSVISQVLPKDKGGSEVFAYDSDGVIVSHGGEALRLVEQRSDVLLVGIRRSPKDFKLRASVTNLLECKLPTSENIPQAILIAVTDNRSDH